MTAPPRSVPQTIAILRARYPEALVCTACGRLVATRRESSGRSTLTEEQRRAYVCAECLQGRAEQEGIRAAKVEQAARMRVAKRAPKKPRTSSPGLLPRVAQEPASGARVNSGDSRRVSVTRPVIETSSAPRRGGRPRKHASDRVASRESSRAYRQRQAEVRSLVSVGT
jgi:hypothetical protein